MTDQELSKSAKSAARRLSIYASALPSLGKTGAGGRVRQLLATIASKFRQFDLLVEIDALEKKASLLISSRAKRPSQKG